MNKSDLERLRHDRGPSVVAITRLKFHSPVQLIRAWFKFRRLYKSLTPAQGLIRGTVSIADGHTLLNTSVWESRWKMLLWSGRPEHVTAVQWTYRRVSEVWSAYFVDGTQSESASRWDGLVSVGEDRAAESQHAATIRS